MRAIRRDPDKHYASMEDMLHDLRHLDKVKPTPYNPNAPRVGGSYQQAILLTLTIITICLSIIAIGILAQLIHTLVH